MSATLVTCDGEWGLESSATGDPHVTCSGELVVVDNPPLAALDDQAVAELVGATVFTLVVAFGFRFVRRQLGG